MSTGMLYVLPWHTMGTVPVRRSLTDALLASTARHDAATCATFKNAARLLRAACYANQHGSQAALSCRSGRSLTVRALLGVE